MSGSEQSFGARVYLQWLALSETDPIPKIIATVPLKEVNDQNLGNASIEIEGEESKDNEITIIVSSYDFDADKDISLGPRPANMPWQRRRPRAPLPRRLPPHQCPRGRLGTSPAICLLRMLRPPPI